MARSGGDGGEPLDLGTHVPLGTSLGQEVGARPFLEKSVWTSLGSLEGAAVPEPAGNGAPTSWLVSCTLCGCLVPDPFSEHPQMLSSPLGDTSPTSYRSRLASPRWAPLSSAQWLGVPLGTGAPLPMGVTAVPGILRPPRVA